MCQTSDVVIIDADVIKRRSESRAIHWNGDVMGGVKACSLCW